MEKGRKMNLDELKKHTFIVIGYEHYNPLGVIRSLGENGIKPVAMILKQPIRIASVSKYIGKLYRIDSNEEAIEILLRDYSNNEYKPFVIPCDDNSTEIIDKNYELLKDSFFIPNAGKVGRVTEYMDKCNIMNLAQAHGLNVAQGWKVKKGEIPNNLVYPVMTKPLTSYPDWKQDYHICNDEAELKKSYGQIKANEILLQHYLTKSNEWSFSGFSIDKGKAVFLSAITEGAYVVPNYYAFKLLIKDSAGSKFADNIKQVLADVGYEGVFSADFIDDINGNTYFSEINFRNSAFSWASTKLGMNLPLLWAKSTLDVSEFRDLKKTIPKNYTALSEAGDLSQRVFKNRMISIFTWLKELFKANCLFIWDKKDLKPVVYYWGGLFIFVFKKKLRRSR